MAGWCCRAEGAWVNDHQTKSPRRCSALQRNPRVIKLAGEVIRQTGREHPADAVLREVLKGAHDLSPAETRDISQAVFTYYRWYGWLRNDKGLERRLARALELAERFQKNPFSLPADALRAKAVPAWVAEEVKVSDEWLRSLQREPKLWLRARPGQGRALAKKLRLAGVAGTAGRALAAPGLPDAVLYDGRADLFRTAEFQAGEFEVQDISSQAVGLICSPKPGETWWDACAGEGGKMLHLSDLMGNQGLIWASDRADWRLQKLKRRAGRAHVFNYRAAAWEGGPTLPTKTRFDGVLVDAPCSGVGTWQRNPHARWTTTIEDVKELSALQSRLLANAAAAVKPGGKLIYAVCALTRSETTDVADEFEHRFKTFKPWPVANPLSPALPVSSRVWIWPQQCGGNGMFVAAWEGRPASPPPNQDLSPG
jgi:16S rRNA (cytosine967-C5)-methyltransferase